MGSTGVTSCPLRGQVDPRALRFSAAATAGVLAIVLLTAGVARPLALGLLARPRFAQPIGFVLTASALLGFVVGLDGIGHGFTAVAVAGAALTSDAAFLTAGWREGRGKAERSRRS